MDQAMFEVRVENDILGNSSHVMTLAEIKRFNLCAFECAKKVMRCGGEQRSGMWIVRRATNR